MRIRKTKIDYNEISKKYQGGIPVKEICETLNISSATVYNALQRIKVEKNRNKIRKYSLYEDYFLNIDTEDKSYFLGLLYADGCNNGSGFYITLQDNDIDILNKFKECIGYDGNLKLINNENENQHKYYSLNISSVKVSKMLENIGCNKNKTINAKFPKNIPNDLMNHFIRGIFDGDGSVWKNRKQLGFSIVGNTNIIEYIGNIINSECGIDVKIRKPKRYKCDISIYSFEGNRQAKKVKDYLYKNATIYLERKYLKFKENGN